MIFEAGKSFESEKYEVWLDGRREPLAFKADDRLCFVERYTLAPSGDILCDCVGRAVTELVYGDVWIRRVNTPGYRN